MGDLESRSASDPLRGYEYQLYRSVLDWLSLPIDERLFLERGEDLLTVGDEMLQQQIRDVAAPISLNQQKTLRSLDHFWAYRSTESHINFRYITTGGIGVEQGQPFGPGLKGIELWQKARLLGASAAEEATERIRAYLLEKGKVGEALRTALQTKSADEIHRDLIVPFDWVTNAPGTEAVRQAALELVIQISADPQYRIPAQEATSVLNTLVTEVLRVAAREPTEPLTRGTLHAILSNQALRLVNPNDFRDLIQTVATEFFAQSAGKSVETSVLTSPPPVPARYVRRKRLADTVASTLQQRSFCFVTGSVGTGKSTLAKDIANSSGHQWKWLSLGGLVSTAASDRIDRAWRETLDRPGSNSLVLDDISFDEEADSVIDSVSRLLHTLRAQGANLILTSSRDIPTRLEAAVGIESREAVRVGSFDDSQISELLLQFGADAGRTAELMPVVQRRSAGGHPTLAMAHIAVLKRMHWDVQASELQARSELANVHLDVRRLVKSLEPDERMLLYRLSVAIVSLSRRQMTHVASLPPRIQEPGLVVDRLTGPWLEIDADGSLRKTPLISGLATEVLDENDIATIHAGIADALLVESSLRLDDAVGTLWHGIEGRNDGAIGLLLASLLQQPDSTIRSAARSAEFFVEWGVQNGSPFPIKRSEVRLIVRMAQLRMAALLGRDELVEAVIQATEREMPYAGKTKRDRFMFDGYVLAFGRLPIEATTKRAVSWAKEASKEPAFSHSDRLYRGKKRRSKASSALELAASMVLGRVRSSRDLQDMLSALSTVSNETQREFLEWLAEPRFMLRGVFGQLEIAEFDRTPPRWEDVVTAVRQLYQVAVELNLIQIARLCASQIVKIMAGPLNNPTGALDELTRIEQEVGSDAISASARAYALFRAKNYNGARSLWCETLPCLQDDSSDLQPSDEARYAAMAAAALGDYEDAKKWLMWARERLSEEDFLLSRAVLAIDAAFASWKSLDDAEACRLLGMGIRELLNIYDAADATHFASLKRIGQVMSWISSPDRDALRAMEYIVPDIGMASKLDTITDERVQATPLSYIAACACDLEFRVDPDGAMYDEFRKLFDTDQTVEVSYKAALLNGGWSIRRHEEGIPHVLRSIVAERAHVSEKFGKPMPIADRDSFVARDILIAILSFTSARLDFLKPWAADLTVHGFPLAASVARRAADMTQMGEQELVQLIQSPDEIARMLASIFLGTRFCSNNPRLLSICSYYWTYIADKADQSLDPAGVACEALKQTLAPMVRERFAFSNPQRTVPIMEAALRADQRPWRYLSRLTESLSAVTGRAVPTDIRAILARATETERRWYEDRYVRSLAEEPQRGTGDHDLG